MYSTTIRSKQSGRLRLFNITCFPRASSVLINHQSRSRLTRPSESTVHVYIRLRLSWRTTTRLELEIRQNRGLPLDERSSVLLRFFFFFFFWAHLVLGLWSLVFGLAYSLAGHPILAQPSPAQPVAPSQTHSDHLPRTQALARPSSTITANQPIPADNPPALLPAIYRCSSPAQPRRSKSKRVTRRGFSPYCHFKRLCVRCIPHSTGPWGSAGSLRLTSTSTTPSTQLPAFTAHTHPPTHLPSSSSSLPCLAAPALPSDHHPIPQSHSRTSPSSSLMRDIA